MSRERSPGTHRLYGVERTARVFGVPRSTAYAAWKRAGGESLPARPGPKPALDDDSLVALIREDLATSIFTGEGHRKVWARLKYGKGLRVSRHRVLRLMRENNLLAPCRPGRPRRRKHDGTLVTEAPNLMWCGDGTKFYTLEEGWCWLFTTLDHFNSEVLGFHVCKTGDRFAAAEPVRLAVKREFGAFTQGIAHGLTYRMDNGSQYTADHFKGELDFLGITASYSFVGSPECNGIAERFFRTLKEQVIYCRQFRNLEEAREAIARFVWDYNHHWRLERLGYKTPTEARERFYSAKMPLAA